MQARNERTGFTLVEVTAALAISALVAVAVVPVVGNLSRSETMGQGRAQRYLLRAALQRLVEADLEHATGYRLGADGAQLLTHLALSPDSLAARHLPATVAYRVVHIGGVGWLVRAQASALGGELAELVGPGVTDFTLEFAEKRAGGAQDEWLPVPETVRVRVGLQGGDPSEIAFQVAP